MYVDADPAGLFPIARAERSWIQAIEDGSIRVYGEPVLVRALPTWFLATEPVIPEAKPAGLGAAVT